MKISWMILFFLQKDDDSIRSQKEQNSHVHDLSHDMAKWNKWLFPDTYSLISAQLQSNIQSEVDSLFNYQNLWEEKKYLICLF